MEDAEAREWFESAYGFWLICSYGHARLLRIRASESLVYLRLRCGVRAGIGLRVPPGGLAIWPGGSCLGNGSRTKMVDGCKTAKVAHSLATDRIGIESGFK